MDERTGFVSIVSQFLQYLKLKKGITFLNF
jgi:hypothetical protein